MGQKERWVIYKNMFPVMVDGVPEEIQLICLLLSQTV